jgi:biopolymer transport protein ExbB/TolQ
VKPKISLRVLIAVASIFLCIIFLIALHFLLEQDSMLAAVLTDNTAKNPLYPFSIQHIMWVAFFLGLGELIVRFHDGNLEYKQLAQKYLPENEETILQAKNLPDIYKQVKHADINTFLPRLIQRIILQFYSSKSVDQANSLLNSSLDLFLHEIDLKYNMLRYIMWLIPSLGFIGTVVGISMALAYVGSVVDPVSEPNMLKNLTESLAVAFNTTFVALVQASVLVFLMHIAQEREERALNRSGQYCLDNLVNRLYSA